MCFSCGFYNAVVMSLVYICMFSDAGLLTATATAVSSGLPQCLLSTMCIYRCLYDMALDMSDR